MARIERGIYLSCIIFLACIFCCLTHGGASNSKSPQKGSVTNDKELDKLNQVYRTEKWMRTGAWKMDLQKGMSEADIRGLLGEPKYISRGSNVSVWYYQNIPYCSRKKRITEVNRPVFGYINLINTNTETHYGQHLWPPSYKFPLKKPIYESDIWSEPNWAGLKKNSSNESKAPDSRKDKVKKEKWQDKSKWSLLQINMPEGKVKSILGEPKLIKCDDKNTYKTWVFSEGYIENTYHTGTFYLKHPGELRFINQKNSYILERWDEPFWPEVEK